jgi:hypothetical protein
MATRVEPPVDGNARDDEPPLGDVQVLAPRAVIADVSGGLVGSFPARCVLELPAAVDVLAFITAAVLSIGESDTRRSPSRRRAKLTRQRSVLTWRALAARASSPPGQVASSASHGRHGSFAGYSGRLATREVGPAGQSAIARSPGVADATRRSSPNGNRARTVGLTRSTSATTNAPPRIAPADARRRRPCCERRDSSRYQSLLSSPIIPRLVAEAAPRYLTEARSLFRAGRRRRGTRPRCCGRRGRGRTRRSSSRRTAALPAGRCPGRRAASAAA